ncbi:OLC1v1027467C1 [Oldenlandia corymbosa var. corymbosa]|uniref:OLC1v1027467C1 n=1 Tax=Oldenlandia corymbosa var. corymbosa TaxID=529605 RepID=A0AAV1CAB1_OLDCO|nr:OLC1v1027467C1 [Oldenlandia corymbosa var. corymbosa]
MRRTDANIASIKPQKDKDGLFTVRCHYNGFLTNPPGREYKGGDVVAMTDCDPEQWSRIEVDHFTKTKLGLVPSELTYLFLYHGKDMDDGLAMLAGNDSANKMAAEGAKEGLVDLFVETKDDAEGEWIRSILTQEIDCLSQILNERKGQGPSPHKARRKVAAVKKKFDRSKLKTKRVARQDKLFGQGGESIFQLIDEDIEASPPEIELIKEAPRCGLDTIIGEGCDLISDVESVEEAEIRDIGGGVTNDPEPTADQQNELEPTSYNREKFFSSIFFLQFDLGVMAS